MGFLSVPELIENVAFFITSSSDLLALALTSKRVLSLIIPNHLHYRHLCCDWRRGELWRYLLAHPEITAHCYSIKITCERRYGAVTYTKERLPPSLYFESEAPYVHQSSLVRDDESPAEATASNASLLALEDVIRTLPQLAVFQWLGDIWPTHRIFYAVMSRRRCLQELEIAFLYNTHIEGAIAKAIPEPFLPYLTRLVLYDNYLFNPRNLTVFSYAETLSTLFRASPSLVDLCIDRRIHESVSLDVEAIDDLFRTIKLPNLRRLTVDYFCLNNVYEAFFKTHPQLETLCVEQSYGDSPKLVFAHLPCLKNLIIDWLPNLDQFSPEVLQGLTCFEVSADYNNLDNSPQLVQLLKQTWNLTTLIICHVPYHRFDDRDGLSTILRCVPRLKRLFIEWIDDDSVPKEGTQLSDSLKLVPGLTHLAYIDLPFWKFANLPEVTHITPPYEDYHYAAAVQEICAAALSLEQIRFWPDKLAIVRRSPDGAYESHELVDKAFDTVEWNQRFITLNLHA